MCRSNVSFSEFLVLSSPTLETENIKTEKTYIFLWIVYLFEINFKIFGEFSENI